MLLSMSLLPYIKDIKIYLVALLVIFTVNMTRYSVENLSNEVVYALMSA